MYELSDRERQALAQADRLNAILSQSSIAEGAAAAQQRAREQAALRLQALRQAADSGDLDATLLVRQLEGNANRQAQQQLVSGLAALTAPEQRDVRGQAQTYTQLGNAADVGQQVVDQGGDFKGVPDVVVGALRDWEFGGLANIVAEIAYSPDELKARGLFASAIGDWRKNLSGAQVTGIERVLGADWDPTAPGISSAEAIARARRLQGFINQNRGSLGLPALGAAPGGGGGAPAPQPQGRIVEHNGKRYQVIGEDVYELD